MIVAIDVNGSEALFEDHDDRDLVVRYMKPGFNNFEKPLPALLHECMHRSPGLLLDVGASSGAYSIIACLASPAVRVIAYEPHEQARAALERNIALNRLGSRIAVRPQAVSDRSGTSRFYIPPDDHGQLESESSLEATFNKEHGLVLEIEAVRLDDERFAGPVAMMKVDVEGHEAAVLAGGRRTIERDRPLLVVELLERADLAFVESFRRALGYTDVRLRRDHLVAGEDVAYDRMAWNHALVPEERMSDFAAAARALQLIGV